MSANISIQLFSVRDQAQQDYEGTIRAIANMGFGHVEPAGFPGSSPAEAAVLFKELGLKATSCHGPLPLGDNKNQIIEDAQMLGSQYIITGCPSNFQKDFESIDTIKATAERYVEASEFASQFGIQVGYHNHDWDLIEVEGRYGYQVFLENTPESVLWEADVFWVSKAGLNPVEFIKEIGSRGKCLHFKDGIINPDDSFKTAETESGKVMLSSDTPFRAAGQGQVDLVAASKVSDHAELICVELDSYDGDMMEAVKESYDYLTGQGIAKGMK